MVTNTRAAARRWPDVSTICKQTTAPSTRYASRVCATASRRYAIRRMQSPAVFTLNERQNSESRIQESEDQDGNRFYRFGSFVVQFFFASGFWILNSGFCFSHAPRARFSHQKIQHQRQRLFRYHSFPTR